MGFGQALEKLVIYLEEMITSIAQLMLYLLCQFTEGARLTRVNDS